MCEFVEKGDCVREMDERVRLREKHTPSHTLTLSHTFILHRSRDPSIKYVLVLPIGPMCGAATVIGSVTKSEDAAADFIFLGF